MTGVTLRICREPDADALLRLAERDCAAPLSGAVLGAEVHGELVAAVSLESRRVVADPFRPTADVVELLRRRERQIRRAGGGRGTPLSPPWTRRRPRGSGAAAVEAG
jgi:hypothetical protein